MKFEQGVNGPEIFLLKGIRTGRKRVLVDVCMINVCSASDKVHNTGHGPDLDQTAK